MWGPIQRRSGGQCVVRRSRVCMGGGRSPFTVTAPVFRRRAPQIRFSLSRITVPINDTNKNTQSVRLSVFVFGLRSGILDLERLYYPLLFTLFVLL